MRKFLKVAPFLLLTCCVAPPPPAPPPPAPPPPPPPAPVIAEDWRDIPLTPGSWAYSADTAGSSALFGTAGAEAAFIVRCNAATREIIFSRAGAGTAASASIGFTTSAGARSYASAPDAGTSPRLVARTTASDPFLDRIAFSRGRFVVTVASLPRLVLPAWPEVARTVEDCRK